MSYDYAAWAGHNKDGSWTRQLERSVQQSKLPQLKPADITQFCPAYPKLTLHQRSKFWVGLLSAMAKPESNFQPLTRYQEKFRDGKGKPVISRGLLQISQESANQPRYSCNITKAEQLHDPAINLSCAVRIMQKWVQTDGQISSSDWGTQAKGAARYWSVLRPARGQLPQIRRFTSQLPVCRAS
ncbi:transglycosylase SLT domain-containing protein [Rheinheimera sp.]|uniref:transglycosylase SLT domain-containing protein n=1 Tax=Rheinheimera sp. TaxID=1869214 RepID=UPI00307E9400